MQVANIHQAKTQLSRLIKSALQGEEVIIANAGTFLVKLVAFDKPKEKRKPGFWKGKVKISKDFDELPEEFLSYFTK